MADLIHSNARIHHPKAGLQKNEGDSEKGGRSEMQLDTSSVIGRLMIAYRGGDRHGASASHTGMLPDAE